VKIVNKFRNSNGARVGLCVAACLLASGVAHAEVELVEKAGWSFTFDGRVNSFLSGGFGQDLPRPVAMGAHTVMGSSSSASAGVPNAGWPANYGQSEADGRFVNIRVRSGMYPNILGFGIARKINDTTTIRGYISIWSQVESLAQDKWSPIVAEAREGHLTVTGNWGAVRVGRMLGWIGRASYEIDSLYGHGFGVGLPCTDALGPACGHIGTGVIFPGYSAGVVYETPSLGGLKLHLGAFDPVVYGAGSWDHAQILRPEGALSFEQRIGASALIKFEVEGFWQSMSRLVNITDMATGMILGQDKLTTDAWGASGGLRVEAGPVRIGVSGFRGKGLGLFYALQRSNANADPVEDRTHQLRMFTGFYGTGALVFGDLRLMGGFGMALVDQTADDKINATLSVIRYQRGISGGIFYNATENIVLGLDYFLFAAGWWGAPIVDPNTMAVSGKLAGETQVVNFVNAGVTYWW
jgi:hypothetical protein